MWIDSVTLEPSVVIEVAVHPSPDAQAIIINYPGYLGSIDGYNKKYATIADHLSQKKVGAVVRMANTLWPHINYRQSVLDDLRAVIRYTLGHAAEMCATATPDIYLMGFSAGAGAVAAVAAEYPAVKKILLMAPSEDAGKTATKDGLAAFSGEVYIVVGSDDEVVGFEAGRRFLQMGILSPSRHLVVLPNCDHQFRGRVNGQIMSKAPLWAFAGDETFPSPEGGIELY